MNTNERFSGLAKLGRKPQRSDQRRRGTPIPVAPPRVPTPMPLSTEVEKLSQQSRKCEKISLNYIRGKEYGDETPPWINPRVMARAKQGNFPAHFAESVNELHHSTQMSELQNRNREKQKFERDKLQEWKKRSKGKWPHGECRRDKLKSKEETLNVISNQIKNSEKYLNRCIGEKDVAGSLTCAAIESGRATPASRSTDRFATKANNNYNYTYYGFLDSGDECTNDTSTGIDISEHDSGDRGQSARTNAAGAEVYENVKNKMSTATGKEIVYENLRIETHGANKKSGKSDPGKSQFRNRGELKKQNYEHRSGRFLEYNLKFGKYENKLRGFPAPEPPSRDTYDAGAISGSSFGDYGGLCDGFSYLESKYTYSVTGIPGNLAQSSAAAAFFARASQKLNLSSPHRRKRHASSDNDPSKSSGFCGAIHRSPPPMPPALLRRIGVKEVTGVGKVKVMLKVMGVPSEMPPGSQSFFNVDTRKKQVTLYDPAICGVPAAPEDRRVGVAAPKMFAFDAIFTQDDSQAEICSTALTDVIHAVINGTDGCLFCFGHARLGKTATMLGTPESANTLGVIPCAISWLFRGIHEQKQKTGARFSVRVSAVEVCQPTQQLKDLLAGHANDCEQSPGVYLRDDPLFGTQLQNQSELRVPNAEKAAFYLDAAVNSRSGKEEGRDSHFLFTLHVYQYSVAGKGGVAGGRSRLHLIDLGSSERGKASGGIPLSGLGNVLLAIFNGQKHLPYREHKITQLLKECLSSLTCHAAMIAHVSQSSQHYTDTLTTVQLASRIHRMRRKKIKFGGHSGPSVFSNGSSSDEISRQNASTGSSDFDPSSSEQSADTVIYVAPNDDAATDGEHPPVYLLNLNSVDNRCGINKAVRSSNVEIRPGIKSKIVSPAKSATSQKAVEEESCSGSPFHKGAKSGANSPKSSPVRTNSNKISTKSNVENHGKTVSTNSVQVSRNEEQWVDGPRISKQKVAEARNLLLKDNMKRETWVDGPMQKPSKSAGNGQSSGNYGFMDSHKKSMIRKWVENQTVHLKQTLGTPGRPEPLTGLMRSSEPIEDDKFPFKTSVDHEELGDRQVEGSSEIIKSENLLGEETRSNITVSTALIRQTDVCFKELRKAEQNVAEANGGESSESSEEEKLPPPPLPLILRYGKDLSIGGKNEPINALDIRNDLIDDYDEEEDEIELEIVEITDLEEPVPMQDSCLQVTEEDIALCMGEGENPLPEVDQESHDEHPLRVLSQENLTVVSTFTDSMSVTTDLERCLPRPCYAPPSLFDQPFYPNGPYFHDEYIEQLTKNHSSETDALDQLARLHELYKSKIVISNASASKTAATRGQSLSLSDVFENVTIEPNEVISGNCSIYSEPAYRPPGEPDSICHTCKKSISKGESADKAPKSQKNMEKLPAYCKKNISLLRHPDGASNPNLDEEEKKVNGTSKPDFDEEAKERTMPKKKVTEHKRGSSSSPNRKSNHHNIKLAHDGLVQNDKSNDQIKGTDLLKLNENNIKLNNSPTRNSNSSSRGELRRTNSASTNKSRRFEENEVTKSATPPPALSSSPLTQKHLYFNKTCPSNEGSDSGHESNVSPKLPKLTGRPRPQAQCESSGYESVVSFTSSLESEVGVKLVRDDTEEIHDTGGQSGWWCWCVSGGPTTAQNPRRQSQRHSSTERTPLTVPPSSANSKN